MGRNQWGGGKGRAALGNSCSILCLSFRHFVRTVCFLSRNRNYMGNEEWDQLIRIKITHCYALWRNISKRETVAFLLLVQFVICTNWNCPAAGYNNTVLLNILNIPSKGFKIFKRGRDFKNATPRHYNQLSICKDAIKMKQENQWGNRTKYSFASVCCHFVKLRQFFLC